MKERRIRRLLVFPVEFVDEDDEIVDETTGEYPEVPPGYPFAVVWQASEEKKAQIPPDLFEDLETLGRVMIKLWNEGDHGFIGASMANGKVYPTYPDVAYVTWSETEKPDGTIYEYISGVTAANDTIADQILNGETPSGIEIVDEDYAGIDPYEFLSQ